ncbi:3-isopropylmalate dehydratase [bacterium]|nr:3-isopropylmalate dehydratase [bacterium]
MIKGKIHKFGDDINTDVIFPGKYTYSISDPKEMAKHAMENLDPEFAEKAVKGDVIVAGKNFGCGSSREQAATCLKYAGIEAIIACSFSRIFFRNAINNAILAIVSKEVYDFCVDGEPIIVYPERGVIQVRGKEYNFPKLSPDIMGILKDGGLIEHTKKKLSK